MNQFLLINLAICHWFAIDLPLNRIQFSDYGTKWWDKNWGKNWTNRQWGFVWWVGTIKTKVKKRKERERGGGGDRYDAGATPATPATPTTPMGALGVDVFFGGETPQRGVAVHQWPVLIRFMQRFSPDFTRCCPNSCQWNHRCCCCCNHRPNAVINQQSDLNHFIIDLSNLIYCTAFPSINENFKTWKWMVNEWMFKSIKFNCTAHSTEFCLNDLT